MTAEIAVLNRYAVGLAADSAVTVTTKVGTKKVYNTANKLFALSYNNPVGVMFYDDIEFMQIPWESLFKVYRESRQRKELPHLCDYAKDFRNFLESLQNSFLPSQEQEIFFAKLVHMVFTVVQISIDEKVAGLFKTSPPDESQISQVAAQTIEQIVANWGSQPDCAAIPVQHAEESVLKYERIVESAEKEVFEKHHLPDEASKRLRQICAYIFCKKNFVVPSSGLVFAGFGRDDIFPSVCRFSVASLLNGRLQYDDWKEDRITFQESSLILPFAQDETAKTFLRGISSDVQSFIDSEVSQLLRLFPMIVGNVIDKYGGLVSGPTDKFTQGVSAFVEDNLKTFRESLDKVVEERFVDPIKQSVSALAKDELAGFAEALVNLTSLKQKVSPGLETVGGPIDVAVITKGDGFVWIKRKHYFPADLNPAFLAKYYRREGEPGRGEEPNGATEGAKNEDVKEQQ